MRHVGVSLNYGYKLSEEQFRQVFETDFKLDWEKKKKKCQSYGNTEEYDFDYMQYEVYEYIDEYMNKKYVTHYPIECGRLACCAYRYDKSWMIGFNLGNFHIYDFKAIDLDILNAEKYQSELLQIYHDLNLKNFCDEQPCLYALAGDCYSCT